MYKKILLPTDGSKNSYKAIKHAYEIAKDEDAEILVLNVVDSKHLTSLPEDALTDEALSVFEKQSEVVTERVVKQIEEIDSDFATKVSTLLTVGYGDIYPVTVLGKMFSIIITFLGVGMVAIPTGILSAGFVEQYSLIKKSTDYLMEKELKFIKLIITKDHNWNEKKVCELSLPRGLILAAVLRNGETLMPKGDMKLFEGDCVVIGARDCDVNVDVNLKQVELREHHPWVGHKIKELDISRHTLIVMIRRGDNAIVPNGDTLIKSGDIVFVFSKRYMADAQTISV